MTVFGLTGGIACGKSSVTEILRGAGVPMVDADEVARSLVEPGSKVLGKIVARFGAGMLLEDGGLNRRKLGMLVFNDTGERRALEQIMTIPLRKACDAAIEELKKTQDFIGYDCALIIESRQQSRFRPLVVVTAPLSAQVARLMSRNTLTEEQAMLRIKSQMSSHSKLKWADYTICNDSDIEHLTARTMEVYKRLRSSRWAQ